MYRLYCPNCIFCGARLIQNLAKLQIPTSECSARRKSVLADWLAHGHREDQIRKLVSGPLAIGPDVPTEPASQTKTKRR